MTWKDLVAESELSFGFIKGVGIGSILLALVVIVFIIRRGISDAAFKEAFQQLRSLIERKN